MSTITKSTIAASLVEILGCTNMFAKDAVDDLVTVVQGTLYQLNSIRIPSICRLDVNLKQARPGRNPKTGAPHTISKRHSVTAVTSVGQREPKGSVIGKGSLIETLGEFEYSKREATAIVETFYTAIGNVLTDGSTVSIRGLGTFYTRTFKAGTLRNPKSGEPVQVGERTRVAFKCSKRLLKAIDTEWL